MNIEKKLYKLLLSALAGVGIIFITRKGDTGNIIVDLLERKNYEGWDFAHILLHFMITAIDYNNWKYSLILGIGWEQIESMIGGYWKDNSNHDYKVNSLGMILGMLFNYFIIN